MPAAWVHDPIWPDPLQSRWRQSRPVLSFTATATVPFRVPSRLFVFLFCFSFAGFCIATTRFPQGPCTYVVCALALGEVLCRYLRAEQSICYMVAWNSFPCQTCDLNPASRTSSKQAVHCTSLVQRNLRHAQVFLQAYRALRKGSSPEAAGLSSAEDPDP